MKRRLGGLPKGEGRAVDDLGPDKPGYVVVEGEYWKAKSGEPIPSGSRVQVTGAEGKILTVEKKESIR
jgi:membrane-bound serine protease (ClpP class)